MGTDSNRQWAGFDPECHQPLWTILLAHFLTRDERLTSNKFIGILFGIFGVITLIGWDLVKGVQGNVLAQIAVVGAAVSYTFAGIFGKRFKGTSPLVLATGQLTSSTVLMLPIVLWLGHSSARSFPSLSILAAILGLAVLSTSLAYIIYFRLLSTAGASNLLLVTFLIPVSAITLGVIILRESIALHQFTECC